MSTTWSIVHVTIPLTGSVPLVRTVTSEVYQSLSPRSPAVTESSTVGADLSILIVNAWPWVVRPAPFVQLPLTVVVPSALTVWELLQLTPLMSSMPVVVTTTSVVYQPLVPSTPDVTLNTTSV